MTADSWFCWMLFYNHFGPEGNYLRSCAPQFFTDRHCTPWGGGINFDALDSQVVRDFFIHKALYWLTEYYFDGLRLDAVHAIIDGHFTRSRHKIFRRCENGFRHSNVLSLFRPGDGGR